jgi:Ser/Thr protein kinase RdoA (MazF antagonist)
MTADSAGLREAAEAFGRGQVSGFAPLGSGLIHDTYRVDTAGGGAFVLQRVNTRVFPDLGPLMANLARVCAHLERQDRLLTPRLLKAPTGDALVHDAAGGCWRAFELIRGTVSPQGPVTPALALEVARGFGAFQRALADLPGPRLSEVIVGFHDTPRRRRALEDAIAANRAGRARECAAEIAFAGERAAACGFAVEALKAGRMPERATHNDAKPDNALLDARDGRCVGVLDLDTVMPGAALYDLGDLVRSMGSGIAEDQVPPEGVRLQLEVYRGLVRGYTAEMAGLLVPEEKRSLAMAGWLITFENGMRFLADYLDGDRYYKTTRPGQNLDRCRNQFGLVADMERQRTAMEDCVAEALKEARA